SMSSGARSAHSTPRNGSRNGARSRSVIFRSWLTCLISSPCRGPKTSAVTGARGESFAPWCTAPCTRRSRALGLELEEAERDDERDRAPHDDPDEVAADVDDARARGRDLTQRVVQECERQDVGHGLQERRHRVARKEDS